MATKVKKDRDERTPSPFLAGTAAAPAAPAAPARLTPAQQRSVWEANRIQAEAAAQRERDRQARIDTRADTRRANNEARADAIRDTQTQDRAAALDAEDEAANPFNPADWGDADDYNPFATPPASGSGSFGLDASHNYGNPSGAAGYLSTGVGKEWIKQNPQAFYTLAQAGAGNPTDDTTAYGRYLQSQYDDLYASYGAAQGISPNLTWNAYLAPLMGQQERRYRERPFQQRGDVPMVTGGATWLGGW